jgi:hypothetical protein
VNFKILYWPGEETTLQERKRIGVPVNPLFHSELSYLIPQGTSETAGDSSEVISETLETKPFRAMESDQPLQQNVTSTPEVQSLEVLDPSESEAPSVCPTVNSQSLAHSCSQMNHIQVLDDKNGAREDQSLPEEEDKLDLSEDIPHLDTSEIKPGKRLSLCQNYIRKNIFYKTLLRDFRKYIVQDFEDFYQSNLDKLKFHFKNLPYHDCKFCQLRKHIRKDVFPQILERYVRGRKTPLLRGLGKFSLSRKDPLPPISFRILIF